MCVFVLYIENKTPDFGHNLSKCSMIFKILLLVYSQGNVSMLVE